jgi:hypothetical protein
LQSIIIGKVTYHHFLHPILKYLPEWGVSWWKVFEIFIQLMCCDRKLNFHYELAPCEVVWRSEGPGRIRLSMISEYLEGKD